MFDVITGLVALVAGGILIIWWLPSLVHELGHLLGAVVSGARADFIPLGPFVLTRTAQGARLRRQLRRSACDATIPAPGRAQRQLFVATALGPLLNLLVGIPALFVAFDGRATSAWYLGQLTLIAAGLYMALFGVFFLLPWRPYGVPTDGRRVLSLLSRTPSAHRWVALRLLTASLDAGVRPREWPPKLIESLRLPADGSIDDIGAALYLYWHLLDGHRSEEARACLEAARAAASYRYLTEVNSRLVLSEIAYAEARAGSDPSIAADSLLRSVFFSRTTRDRVLAAVALSYAYVEEAKALADEAVAYLGELRPGFAQMESDLLQELLDECAARRAAMPSPSGTNGAPDDKATRQGAD